MTARSAAIQLNKERLAMVEAECAAADLKSAAWWNNLGPKALRDAAATAPDDAPKSLKLEVFTGIRNDIQFATCGASPRHPHQRPDVVEASHDALRLPCFCKCSYHVIVMISPSSCRVIAMLIVVLL
jgi:hypothetical protein